VGTLDLLNEDERKRICGVIINKFRGDMEILKPGIDMLEKKINKPVLGVIPYFDDIKIDNEDSVCLNNINSKLETKDYESSRKIIDIAVIRFPRISNFTDFDLLKRERDVRLRFIDKVESFGEPDLIILPGTKNTIGDLKFIKENGIAETIIDRGKRGAVVVGICGGYQMLGKEIKDPENAESNMYRIDGLGLLNVTTTFMTEKSTYQVKARMNAGNMFNVKCDMAGYEIHMGETMLSTGVLPFLKIVERSGNQVSLADGAISNDGNVMGTYLHGIFDNDEFRLGIINYLRRAKGLSPLLHDELLIAKREKEKHFDKLADLIRKHVNMEYVFNLIS